MSSYIENNHIAKHYAAILYDLAKQLNKIDAAKGELQAMAELQKNDAIFADFCNNPTLGRVKKLEVMAQIAVGCGELVANLLRVLAQNNRLPLLSLVAKFFTDLERADKGEIVVELSSAHELSTAQQQKIQENVAKAFNAVVILDMRIDESLIAGVKIKYGSHELDASAQARLRMAEVRLHDAIEHMDKR